VSTILYNQETAEGMSTDSGHGMAEGNPLLLKRGPPEGKRWRLTLHWHRHKDRLVQLNQELGSCKADVSNAYAIVNLLATNLGIP